MTVLIVDDEPEYRMTVREVLMKEGYDVLTAENGEEALGKLAVIQPDIIVSDVYMPVMDGQKLHQLVREDPRYRKLPFLFVSGYSDDYTMNTVRDPRYDGFLRKGTSSQQLKEWIQYLTTPEEKRSKFLPGQSSRLN